MAAFLLITFSVGVDLYQVGLRCWQSGFSGVNILAVLRELHDELRTNKYLECINEIYESDLNSDISSDFHRIGIACINCRRQRRQQQLQREMICEKIENAIEVDGCEEAFEIISNAVSVVLMGFLSFISALICAR